MNLKLFFTLFVSALSFRSICQNKITHSHNSIDDIQTSNDIMRFVIPLLQKNYQTLDIPDTVINFSSSAFKKWDSTGKFFHWLKTDLNNDGNTDLLVLIKDTLRSKDSLDDYAILVQNTGKTKPYLNVVYNKVEGSAIPVYTTLQKLPAILYYHFHKDTINNAIDTTFYELPGEREIFMAGAFVEYNPHPKKFDIQAISYKTTNCYGACPVFEITIGKNKNAKYEAIEFNRNSREQKISGTFKTLIDSKRFAEIKNLISYLNFPVLNDKYEALGSDQQTAILTITYDGGKTKSITDYGLNGTLGLSQLYEMLSALRLNQNWH